MFTEPCLRTKGIMLQDVSIDSFFKWAILGLFFLLFSSFQIAIQLTRSFVDDMSRKRPLYQLSQNHCPTTDSFVIMFTFKKIGPYPASCSVLFVFSTQMILNDCIRSTDLLSRKNCSINWATTTAQRRTLMSKPEISIQNCLLTNSKWCLFAQIRFQLLG